MSRGGGYALAEGFQTLPKVNRHVNHTHVNYVEVPFDSEDKRNNMIMDVYALTFSFTIHNDTKPNQ